MNPDEIISCSNKEVVSDIQKCKTADEIRAFASNQGINLTEDEINFILANFCNRNPELTESELDLV